jgi:hypothetical protein
MNRKQVAAITLTLWLTIVLVFMLLVQRIDLDIFFVLIFIGILVIAELMKHQYVQPRYLGYLGYLIGAGIVVFVIIIGQKFVEILVE